MDKTLEINEGLRLMVLVRLDGRKVPEIAKELGFDPGYISKLQKMDNLPNATRKNWRNILRCRKRILQNQTLFLNPRESRKSRSQI